MSKALFEAGGLRFWSEAEICKRDAFVESAALAVRDALRELNPAWQMQRVEGPCLAPSNQVSSAYSDDDVFVTNHNCMGSPLRLRAETTATSYTWARHLMQNHKWAKPPICVWQVGKSFRRETNDGASASKLRYNEFYQLEFQCIYRADTKADYRLAVINKIEPLIRRSTGLESRLAASDRLPSYSQSTLDIEVLSGQQWREIASCSIRNDFAENVLVCEIAIGLDRVLDVVPSEEQDND